MPPLEERRKISAALSDVDTLITSLEKLIAKKRAIKTATMQQLLTGKKRLPEFERHPNGELKGYKQTELGEIPEDWGLVSLGELISEISMGPFGSDITVSNFVDEGVPVLNGSNVSKERLTDSFSNFVTKQKAKSLKKAVASRGDVIVTHRGTIGQVSYIPEDSKYERYVISQSQFRARFKEKVLPNWITTYFLSGKGSVALLEGKGHTGVPAIAQPTTTFRKLQVVLPSYEEQLSITGVLSSIDAEIRASERQLLKTQQLKQGMMQELLTGRTRLV